VGVDSFQVFTAVPVDDIAGKTVLRG